MSKRSAIDKEIIYLRGMSINPKNNKRIEQLKMIKRVHNEMETPLKMTLTSIFNNTDYIKKKYRELIHRVNCKVLRRSYSKGKDKLLDIPFIEGTAGDTDLLRFKEIERFRTKDNVLTSITSDELQVKTDKNITRLHIHNTIDIRNKPINEMRDFISIQWMKLTGATVDFSDYEFSNFEPDKWSLYSSKDLEFIY